MASWEIASAQPSPSAMFHFSVFGVLAFDMEFYILWCFIIMGADMAQGVSVKVSVRSECCEGRQVLKSQLIRAFILVEEFLCKIFEDPWHSD